MKYFPGIILIILLITSFTGCNGSEVSDRERAEQKALIDEKRDMENGLAAAITRIDEIISCGDMALALKLSNAAEEIFGSNARLTIQRQTIANTSSTNHVTKEIPTLPLLYKSTEELDQFMFMEDPLAVLWGCIMQKTKLRKKRT